MWDMLVVWAMIDNPFMPLSSDDYFNPESPSICLILWILSTSPIYIETLNKCLLTENEELVAMMGPLAHVLFWVTQYHEEFREDQMNLGKNYEDSPLGDFCCSTLLFRASKMNKESIDEWK